MTSTDAILAIHGGTPVRPAWLPYGRQAIEEEDIAAVVATLRSDWLTTGPKVDEFEHAFAGYVGAKHAIAFSNGTAALHGAAFAAGLGLGDEAITTPMTFCATSNAVLYQGARPVFADVRPDTLNLDPVLAEACITPLTKAILPVDFTGNPAQMDAFMALAETHGLVVIEDAAHAVGADWQGHRVGSIAHMTTFSFHPVKHLTTAEGGMVTTNDDALATKLRTFRNHGITRDSRQRELAGDWFYEMSALGFNYRLPDVACALGLSQLRRIESNLARRRAIAAQYDAAFVTIPQIGTPKILLGANPAWHLYPIQLDLVQLNATRGEVFRALRAENIGVNVHYIPVHLHPYYRENLGTKPGDFPVAEAAYERLISLPMFHGMNEQDVDDTILAVRKVIAHFAK